MWSGRNRRGALAATVAVGGALLGGWPVTAHADGEGDAPVSTASEGADPAKETSNPSDRAEATKNVDGDTGAADAGEDQPAKPAAVDDPSASAGQAPSAGAGQALDERVDGPVAYLTFDVEGRGAREVLDALRVNRVRATMFLLGMWAQGNAGWVQQMVAEGHELGNHSYSHPHFPRLSEASARAEIERAESIIVRASGGVSPRPRFRFPYGDGQRTGWLLNTVAREGYMAVYWSVDPQDWRGISPAAIVQNVLANTRNGSIVLMHPASPGTAAALPSIIAGLRARGFGFRVL